MDPNSNAHQEEDSERVHEKMREEENNYWEEDEMQEERKNVPLIKRILSLHIQNKVKKGLIC